MNITEIDISNNNIKNCPTDVIYKAFNDFIFSTDIKLLGKLLHRYHYFNLVKDLPGDIVEVGVFKGSGVATFSKFIEIYCPNSNKKVIGFDIFDTDDANNVLTTKDNILDKTTMQVVYSKLEDNNELKLENVINRINDMSISKNYMLVKGDVEESLPKFIKENPGFRISLLYIDVDIERPTYNTLKYLWDRILPGGVILLDEYEYHKFSESTGVDKFLKEFNIPYNLKSTNFIAPTAYIIKS